jgi:hypothetical protein
MLIMVHIFAVYATIFLFALHVSTLMGHHQMLSVTYHLLLSQRNIHTFTLTYIGHESLSFFFNTFGDVKQW